jgi:hypothetical protein
VCSPPFICEVHHIPPWEQSQLTFFAHCRTRPTRRNLGISPLSRKGLMRGPVSSALTSSQHLSTDIELGGLYFQSYSSQAPPLSSHGPRTRRMSTGKGRVRFSVPGGRKKGQNALRPAGGRNRRHRSERLALCDAEKARAEPGLCQMPRPCSRA